MSKVALVTGGSRGIGAATSRLLAAQGYAVAINYRSNAGAADELCTELSAQGFRCMAVQGDVADEAQVVSMFDVVSSTLGAITHLVNNAGILEQQMTLAEMSPERLQRVFATNVTGTFLCCREAVRRMTEGGAIVNLSSVAAKLGSPGEYIDYAASKAAVDTLTIGLAREVADRRIRVNAVRPGVIHTTMHADGGEPGRVDRVAKAVPMQRGGQPEEVASAIAWLLSDEASYITGTLLDVSGGR